MRFIQSMTLRCSHQLYSCLICQINLKRKKTTLFILGVVLLALLSGVVFAFVRNNNSQEKINVTKTNSVAVSTPPSVTADSQVADITTKSQAQVMKADLDSFF